MKKFPPSAIITSKPRRTALPGQNSLKAELQPPAGIKQKTCATTFKATELDRGHSVKSFPDARDSRQSAEGAHSQHRTPAQGGYTPGSNVPNKGDANPLT